MDSRRNVQIAGFAVKSKSRPNEKSKWRNTIDEFSMSDTVVGIATRSPEGKGWVRAQEGSPPKKRRK